VMNTGAHPDDEQSGMLAAMRYGYGMRVVVACSTRGEGGQNAIGPERSGALGVVRTRELEEAMKVIDGDVVWLGHGPTDPVTDFGFSKNGGDTLERWGRERLLERLVRAYRTERPDIVIPTFLDVPGQHGHHRAMTEAAEAAIPLAADPEAFPDHLAEGLSPWQVAKYYLPAWSGGGGTYDDEVPPPDATVAVTAPGLDPVTGAAYDEIGQWSRSYHATQGMGVWRAVPQTRWPLHLKLGDGGAETDLRDGLPNDLGDLADLVNVEARPHLIEAQRQIEIAMAAFPHRQPVVAALLAAADAVELAAAELNQAAGAIVGHRLARKSEEIDAALLIASGARATAWLETPALSPGETTTLRVHLAETDVAVTATPIASRLLATAPAEVGAGMIGFSITVPPDAAYSSPYPPAFSGLGGNGELFVRLEAEIGGRRVCMPLDLEEPLQVVPPHSVQLDPEAVILPLPTGAAPIAIAVRVDGPPAVMDLGTKDGFAIGKDGSMFSLRPQPDLAPGRYTLPVLLDGKPAYRQTPIAYPHLGRTRFIAPQALEVLALKLALPEAARVGYIGGGSDNVGTWLKRMGLDVTLLGPQELTGELDRYTTLVVGIFTFGLRPDLAASTAKLHDWVRAGGHLVTLYHRPGDGWSPEATPPARLAIGSPSLRWRVTDPAAPVDVLAPDHRLLTAPNHIGAADWSGWDKERGLYFASDWDAAYVPLLAMSDKGEAPLKGALLSAPIGRGRHTHTSLVLHHQMDRFVPGAFRLMANLVQPAW
jgi:LmbE family N-acetylglucosaminyl deacetylase